jgi:hypothetical protein
MFSNQVKPIMRATLASGLLIAAALFIAECVNPPEKVGAQNSGNTGAFTNAQVAFTAQAAVGSSPIFSNIGQAAHFLTFCNTGFTGTIDLESSFTGKAPWTPIAIASFGQNSVTDSGCHVLQAGGYFQNVRATITYRSAGSVTAWYSSSSGPIAFAPAALGSNGPTSPIACDKQNVAAVAPVGAAVLVGSTGLMKTYACMVTISFNGATTAGALSLGEATNSNCTTGYVAYWNMTVTANTPQLFALGSPLGSFFSTVTGGNWLCVQTGTIGANATISVSYAQF